MTSANNFMHKSNSIQIMDNELSEKNLLPNKNRSEYSGCNIFKKGMSQFVIDAINTPVLFISNAYEILFINSAAESLLCTDNSVIIGKNIETKDTQEFCSHLCHILFKSIYKKLNNTYYTPINKKWIKSFYNPNSSSKYYYKISATTIFKDSIFVGFLITITDITHHVIYHSKLRTIRSLTKGILDSSRDSIFTFDSSMSIIDMNSCARRQFVNSTFDYIGKKLDDILRINRSTSSKQFIFDALAKQKHNEYLEICAIDRSGREYDFEVSAGIVELTDQTFYSITLYDITKQKQETDQLRLALNHANTKNDAKSSFLAVMSHEMRTPLIGVLGTHEILLDTNLNEEQSRYLDIASASSHSLLNLINGILDFSKIEAGKLELEMLSFNPEDIVNQVVEILSTTAYKKGISLQSYIDPNLTTKIVSDPVRLHQILMNLVNNAIKFTKNGGVSVVALKSKTDPNQLVFEVNDTGIGIPSNKINTIFDEFTQVESSTHRRYGGTGLGLAITYRLVGLLGGELKLSSEPGEGSKFWFTIQSSEPVSPSVYQAPFGLHGVKLLLVDNSIMSSSMLVSQLQSFSLNVTHVNTLNQALYRLASEHTQSDDYKIVIVNLFKLAGNLTQFCTSLEQLPAFNDYSFIVIGPADEIRQTKSYYESVFTSAIPLPIRRTTLIQRIKLLLDKGVDDYKPDEQIEKPKPPIQANTNILIVDDSSTNRIVIESMVNRLGYFTFTAANGEDAISILLHNKIDLVLMDLSMPVMDGIEATIYIRTIPGFRSLPIIALTATAIQEDIDACLHAGMNDYLGKPFTKEVLVKKLTEWTTRLKTDKQSDNRLTSQTVDIASETIDRDDIPDNSPYIDCEILSQMSDNLPAERLPEVVGLFIAESSKRLENIHELAISGDIIELGNQTHALKGSAATFGANLLTPLAEDLEQTCKQGDSKKVIALTKQVIEIGKKTLDAYQNRFHLNSESTS